jgi:peptidyl-prolyl cis-trans isomerase SurA
MRIITLPLLLFSCFLVSGNAGLAQISSDTLLKIAGQPVSKEEFYSTFIKRGSFDSQSKETLKEYLDLYINFRLKVKEAEASGLDTTATFREEFELYRSQLAKNYLTDTLTQRALLNEAFRRSQYDIRASHILVKVEPEASPADTLLAWKKIIAAAQRISKGEDFGKLASEVSEDPSAREHRENDRMIRGNQGDLGYFTVFDMVYPFENAAYSLQLGQVSKPVRTSLGYHLLKLTDSIPAQGQLEVAHIALIPPRDADKDALTHLADTAEMIYNLLQQGQDFTLLALKYSDDKSTSSRGGVLPRFEVSRMVPEFICAIAGLKNPGEFSPPFASPYGWHIVKLIEKKLPGSFEAAKDGLTQRIRQSDRQKTVSEAFVRKVKNEYGFSENTNDLKSIAAIINDSVFDGKWEIPLGNIPPSALFTIGRRNYSTADFVRYINNSSQKEPKVHIPAYLDRKYKQFVNESCIAYANSNLENKYPGFREIIREYHDGILLFTLNDKNVWNRSISDTLGLKAYYEIQKNNYPGPEKLDATTYTILDGSITAKLLKRIHKGTSESAIGRKFNKPIKKLLIERQSYAKGESSLVDSLEWKAGVISPVFQRNGRQMIVKQNGILPPAPKPLAEIRGMLVDNYQAYLDKKWIEELRAKYPVEINWGVFNSITANK